MPKKKNYYNITRLAEKNCTFNLLYGERSNGKSYQVKHKFGMLHYLETGKRFIYMRRTKEELTTNNIIKYFADVDIGSITKGKYNTVDVWRKNIYLAKYDPETFKTTRGEKIGYAIALSIEQNYAGGSYLDVDNIIFEEFMSRGLYLSGEVDKLMNFWCTVDRKRNHVKVWLIGNTLTRANPYLIEWDLLKDVMRMKQGEITTKRIPVNEDGDFVDLAIEYCEDSGDTSFVFGKHASMLNNGEWQSDPQPKLDKPIRSYRRQFRCIFVYKSFQFIGEVLKDPDSGSSHWYIYPRTKIRKDPYRIIVFSDIVKADKHWNSDIYHAKTKSERLHKFFDLFTSDNIFFSDDLTGTEFKEVINFEIKK